MLILSFLCINLLLVSADGTEQTNGHCDSTIHSCDHAMDEIDKKNLVFYTVNPAEGFNLRRDVYMRFAIMLAEAKKRDPNLSWHLVLPPWHNMYHWRYESYTDPPQHWGMFFHVPALKSYAPVHEMYEIMEKTGRYGLKIDTMYVLQHFKDTFENEIFDDKWNVVGPCKYAGKFWGYNNITVKNVICVEFQGSISKLWDIIKLNPKDRKVMFANGEIPLHDTYGTKPYWDCRKSMKFSLNLIYAADKFILKKLKCDRIKCINYLAIHWRRRDFVDSDRAASIEGTARQINDTIKNKSLDISNIFIASDGGSYELENLIAELKAMGYISHLYEPNIEEFSEGQIAIIDQIICTRSAYFIGTHESTFTYRIQEEREILGFDSDTTFNRFCPDKGKCEKPSRWTIVN